MTEIKKDCKAIDSFDDQLDCLRRNLLKAQETLNTTESDISASEKQITAIESLISKRDQIIKDYSLAQPGLDTKQKEFKTIYEDEKSCLEQLLTADGIKKIEAIKKTMHDKVANLKESIEDDKTSLDGDSDNSKRKELEVKKQALEKAKKSYDLWVDPVKSIESRFKSLERIKKEIDKEHSAGNYRYAYYLIELLEKGSFKYYLEDFPGVVEPDELEKELKDAWKAFQNADEAFNNAAGEVKSLEKRIEINRKQLIEDEKNLETTIKRLLDSEIEDGGSGNGGSICGGSSSGSMPDSSGKKQYGNTSADPVPKMPGPYQSGASSQ